METGEKLPLQLSNFLQKKGIRLDSIITAVSSDLPLKNTGQGETWLLVDKKKLYLLSFNNQQDNEQSQQDEDSKIIRFADISQKGSVEAYREIPLAEIEKLESVQKVHCHEIIAIIDEKEEFLVRYRNGQRQKFANFIKIINKIKEGKEIKEDDLKYIEEKKCPDCGMFYPDARRKVCPRCLDKKTIFMRLLGYTVHYRKEIIIVLSFMLLSSSLALISPYLGGAIFFDEVLTEGGRYQGMVVQVVLLMFASRLLALLIQIFYGRISSKIAASVIYDLKVEIFTAMQKLSLSFFTSRETGVLMERVNRDARHLEFFFVEGFPRFLINLFNLLGISIIMFLLNWRLTLVILIPVPLTIYMIKKIYPRLRNMFHRRWRRHALMNATVNNAFTGVRVVKAFGKEDAEIRRFGGRNQDVYDISIEAGYFMDTVFPFMAFFMGIGSYFVWGVGGWQVLEGTMNFGVLQSFVQYTAMFYGPIRFMTHIVDWWSDSMNAAQRIFEIVDADSVLASPEEPVAMPEIKGHVEINDMQFAYEEGKPVLEDISLDVQPGEVIGLVGHSGAGKSTTINLIARLYDVDEGSISIDGVNIKDISQEDLRKQVGIVLQDTFLFNGSIADNIRYAKPEADLQEVIQAAKIANAHDFIVKLPDGYDTMLGSRGKDISGGEKQRLSIARAILHDPRILILDEATSSVDTKTEQLIQQALERLMEGRTTFVIAHRLSTLRNADRLFILEKGKNVESGTHAELIKEKGVYYKLFKKQRDALKVKGVGIS